MCALGLHFFLVFQENPPAHFKDRLEAFAALLRVLAESLYAHVLDFVLDLLPSAAHGSNLGLLLEVRFAAGHRA